MGDDIYVYHIIIRLKYYTPLIYFLMHHTNSFIATCVHAIMLIMSCIPNKVIYVGFITYVLASS